MLFKVMRLQKCFVRLGVQHTAEHLLAHTRPWVLSPVLRKKKKDKINWSRRGLETVRQGLLQWPNKSKAVLIRVLSRRRRGEHLVAVKFSRLDHHLKQGREELGLPRMTPRPPALGVGAVGTPFLTLCSCHPKLFTPPLSCQAVCQVVSDSARNANVCLSSYQHNFYTTLRLQVEYYLFLENSPGAFTHPYPGQVRYLSLLYASVTPNKGAYQSTVQAHYLSATSSELLESKDFLFQRPYSRDSTNV